MNATTAPAGIRCGSCKDRHASVADVRACHSDRDYEMSQVAGERYAEAVMSWVCGGGAPEDASTYANAVLAGRAW